MQPAFKSYPFPHTRQVIVDEGRMAARRHMIHALVEIDVTDARHMRRTYSATSGESLSFTAFLIKCAAHAVDMDRSVQACRNWRNQLVVFEDVDVLTIVEIDLDGAKFPLAHIIRAANKRTLRAIHDEIRAVQANPQASPSFKLWWIAYWWLYVPALIRQLVYRIVSRNPFWVKKYLGTVGLTAVGMFGTDGGWGIGLPNHTLGITVGGITQKPGVVNGQIAIREFLHVTIDADHDVIDGAPLARFVNNFRNCVESCYGLSDLAQTRESGEHKEVIPSFADDEKLPI